MLKKITATRSRLTPNSPTSNELKVTEPKDFHGEKKRLVALLHNSIRGRAIATTHPHPSSGLLPPGNGASACTNTLLITCDIFKLESMNAPTVAELIAKAKHLEILFW